MTVLPRGARNRRGGRRPGWLLLTALLVLAILASSTLVFTSSVQLLRLAVILSLWAAALAAFVSVIYRRQSEADQARARDMKFVYDLQLDREISARREYELGVEAHLRRQMARERGQAADELTALRAELASLRSNLEVLLGAELGDRPAIEADRVTAPTESMADAFVMPPPPGKVESSRVTEDVVEERVEFAEFVVEVTDGAGAAAAAVENPIIDVPEEPLAPPVAVPADQSYPAPADRYRGSHRRTEVPAQPVMAPPAPPARPAYPPPPVAPWRPPETRPRRGRHWTPDSPPPATAPPPAPQPVAPAEPPRGRHWVDPADAAAAAAATAARGRHRDADEAAAEAAAEQVEPTREAAGQHTGGHSVADLMARLNVANPSTGGGRRRRED